MAAPATPGNSTKLPENETEYVEAESRPREGESVAQSLRRSFLFLHGRRGQAYGKLRRVLRESLDANTNDLVRFKAEIANITEDLKLVGEGVRALRRGIYVDYLPHSKTAVKWLDRVQELEDKKLVAFVSLSAIQRSRAAGTSQDSKGDEDGETTEEKMERFTKELDQLDSEITDIIDEIREFIAEQLEDEDDEEQ